MDQTTCPKCRLLTHVDRLSQRSAASQDPAAMIKRSGLLIDQMVRPIMPVRFYLENVGGESERPQADGLTCDAPEFPSGSHATLGLRLPARAQYVAPLRGSRRPAAARPRRRE